MGQPNWPEFFGNLIAESVLLPFAGQNVCQDDLDEPRKELAHKLIASMCCSVVRSIGQGADHHYLGLDLDDDSFAEEQVKYWDVTFDKAPENMKSQMIAWYVIGAKAYERISQIRPHIPMSWDDVHW